MYTGEVPYQSLAYFNSTYLGFAEDLAFTVLDFNEYLGDKLFYFHVENDFGKLLWGNVPVFKNFNLLGFFNAGRSFSNNSSINLANGRPYEITNGIYAEAGFSISRILDILRVNFGWRLNNFKNGRNFDVTLTADVFKLFPSFVVKNIFKNFLFREL